MVELEKYSDNYKEETIQRITEFFGFHRSLNAGVQRQSVGTDAHYDESQRTLVEWQTYPSVLFMILNSAVPVGFLRICLRGPNVAWIEDIYVDPEQRGRGVASDAIREAEQVIAGIPGCTAVCLDVSPRNADALRLYHKLGYTGLSLITVRKEFGEKQRDRTVQLLGLEFDY